LFGQSHNFLTQKNHLFFKVYVCWYSPNKNGYPSLYLLTKRSQQYLWTSRSF